MENIGSKLPDTDLRNKCLDLIQKAKATKAKINKWDYIKFSKFLHRKGNYQKNEKATY